MNQVDEEWPDQAVPVTREEVLIAVTTLRRRASWASGFSTAALGELVEPLFAAGWCPAALRHALVTGPDGRRHATPALSPADVAARWTGWTDPPVQGHELGTALAAQFGRDNDRTIRDIWAAKAIPHNPMQVFRAVKWVRLMFGWSTFATLTEFVKVLSPWFARQWCPEAIKWAVEHHPVRGNYAAPPKNTGEIAKRLNEWERASKNTEPPVAGASWEQIVGVRRERTSNERVREGDGLRRWRERSDVHGEYWRYKRSLPGKYERDQRDEVALVSLAGTSARLRGSEDAPVVDDTLCGCGKYFRLPGKKWCSACAPGRAGSAKRR